MTSPSSSTDRQRPSIWKILGLIGLSIVGLCVIGVCVAGERATRQWQAYLERQREKGEPMTLAELNAALRPTETGETVASWLERSEGSLNSIPGFGLASDLAPGHERRMDRSKLAQARAMLGDHADLLAEMKTLASLPSGRIPVQPPADWTAFMLPDLIHVRSARSLLRIRAYVHLADGEAKQAVRTIDPLFAIGGVLQPAPILYQHLVSLSVDAGALELIQDALHVATLDDATLQHLSSQVRQRETRLSIVWTLRGERSLAAAIIDDPAAFDLFGQPSNAVGSFAERMTARTFVVRGNQRHMTEYMDRLIAVADDPFALLEAARDMHGPGRGSRLYRFTTEQLAPSVARVCELHVRLIVNLRTADAAIAAERFRLAHGRFPAELAELVPDYLPAVPEDPHTGDPLRLVSDEEGITIYAVGEGGDNQGRLHAPRNSGVTVDVGYRLLHPALRGLTFFDPEPEPEEAPMPPAPPLTVVPDDLTGSSDKEP